MLLSKRNGDYYLQRTAGEEAGQSPPGTALFAKNSIWKRCCWPYFSCSQWCLGKDAHLLSWSRPGNVWLMSATHWSDYEQGHSWVEEEWEPVSHEAHVNCDICLSSGLTSAEGSGEHSSTTLGCRSAISTDCFAHISNQCCVHRTNDRL